MNIIQETLKNQLLNLTKDEVKEIFLRYIIETNQYSEYIKLITDIAFNQQKKLEKNIIRTKATSNAIQLFLNDVNINIKNWFVWMRYIDSTEDSNTESLNLIEPTAILNKINAVICNNIIDINHGDYKHLIQRFNELKEKYNIKDEKL